MRYLEILREGQDYEGMFRAILDVVGMTYEGFIRRLIKDVRQKLKRNDRIVWYLRLYRIGICKKIYNGWELKPPADATPEMTGQLQNLYQHYLYQYEQASGLDKQTILSSADHLLYPNNILGTFEHYLSLPIPEITDHVFNYDTVQDLISNFKKAEDEWQQSRQGMIPAEQAEEGGKVILSFPNGYQWWLLDRAHCPLEAEAMGHCGNAPRQSSDDRILSLRKLEKKGKQVFYRPYLTFILLSNGTLGEMKGRFNNSPVNAFENGYSPSDFSNEILALLRLPMIKGITGGGYAPQENFKVGDLSLEQREELAKTKPQMMPLGWRFAKFGITPDLIESILQRVNEDRLAIYDEESKGFVLDTERNFDNFCKAYVNTERGRHGSVAAWCAKVLEGDERLEIYDHNVSNDEKEEVLRLFEKKHPNEYAKLVAYVENEWKTEYPEEDNDDLLDMIETLDLDGIDTALNNAVLNAIESGAKNEMADSFNRWFEDLDKPSMHGFWISMPEKDAKGYSSEVNVLAGVAKVIELIDEEKIDDTGTDLWEIEDISEPYYGWGGFDEEAAVERFRDDLHDAME